MTTSESTDDTRRDAARTGGQLPQSDLTSPGAGKPSVSASPNAGASRSKNDASSAQAGHAQESHDRSSDVKTSSPGDRSDARPSGVSRDESSRSSSGRGAGASEAVRCLISCVEQMVREIPKGAAARFDGVVDELGKARKALDASTSTSSLVTPGARSEGSKAISTASHGAESSGNSGSSGSSGNSGNSGSSGSSRSGRSDEIRPSSTPPTKGGI